MSLVVRCRCFFFFFLHLRSLAAPELTETDGHLKQDREKGEWTPQTTADTGQRRQNKKKKKEYFQLEREERKEKKKKEAAI